MIKIGLSKPQDYIKFEKLCGTNVRVKINTYLGTYLGIFFV